MDGGYLLKAELLIRDFNGWHIFIEGGALIRDFNGWRIFIEGGAFNTGL